MNNVQYTLIAISILSWVGHAQLTSHGIEVQYGQYSYDLLNFDWWESMATLAFGLGFVVFIFFGVTSMLVCAKRMVIKLVMSAIFVLIMIIIVFLMLIKDSFVPTHPRLPKPLHLHL